MSPHGRLFLTLLLRRPLKALTIAWWRITGRRVRALGQLRAAAMELPLSYAYWLALHQSEQRSAVHAEQDAELPLLAVHLHCSAGQSPQALRAAINSVLAQFHQRWELYLTSSADPLPNLPADARIHILDNSPLTRQAGMALVAARTRAAHCVPLDADCTLAPGALRAYAQAMAASSANTLTVFYADQDERSLQNERRNPWLKPAWDENLFLAQDYISAACTLPLEALRQSELANATCPDALAVYAMLTRLLIGPGALAAHHVRYVATTAPANAWCRTLPGRRELVAAISQTEVSEGQFGTLILNCSLPDSPPQVSVIIPTRDRLDLLQACVAGVLHHTDYPNLELVIVDNDSVEPETLAYFQSIVRDARVKVVHWPHPYNYSAINNFAVNHASGAYICLLNNDTEIIHPDWLREMMAHAIRRGIGAVGARLLYPDRTIQHAGVVVGMGGAAGHAHRGLPQGNPGWFAQAWITREATAVTAACLVVEKRKFQAVGGLDERGLAIAYNDVDLCLKLRNAGWRNLYAAQAVLIHHESKSRRSDFEPDNLNRYKRELTVFQNRWGSTGFVDPTFHPNLDPASETYRLRL
ncbi:MAG: glycosyltransferase family 2 protein [Pseudomonadales bacterium]|jgi:GT2 family glycosyltransferase|nr:glycosyltransferase family 2 protein [Pseudomonadales bacterium]